jgi:trigger factor
MIREKYGDYQLNSYDPVVLTLPSFDVSDEDVEKEMRRIAARHATNVDVDPHPINADDLVRIKIKTMDGKNAFPGLTSEAVDVQLGVGTLPEDVELALMGHVPGDTVEVPYEYDDYSQVANEFETPADGGCGAGDAGEPQKVNLVSKVKVLALRRYIVPEITDEWVKKNIALSDTVSDFRARTRKRLTRERKRAYANDVEYDVVKQIGERLVEDLPESPVRDVEKQITHEFERFLEQYDLDKASYLAIEGMSDDDFAAQVHQDAVDRISQDIALASWANHFDVQLEDEDIDFMFGEPTPERTYEARVEAEQSGQIDGFKDLALRAKVTELVTKGATFVRADGSVDEDFKSDLETKYKKLAMVKAHATAAPMLKPPMVPIEQGA